MRALAILLSLWISPIHALELVPAGATEVAREESDAGSVRLPREAWRSGTAYPETTGAIRRTVFQVPNPAMTTLQLSDPLHEALLEAGYSDVFHCADKACGGFDFRFQLDLLPPPAMYVDLGNYRYFLMEHEDASAKLVSVVTSSSATSGYVHITELRESMGFEPRSIPAPVTPPSPVMSNLVDELIETGHVVLGDLEFATGSAELGPGPFASLQSLADWLSRTPGARVVLVGHTDSIGSLDTNLALSRRRASSVMSRLVDELGAAPSQVTSDGAGAISPIASNLTAEGRALNRRVEVVLLAIE